MPLPPILVAQSPVSTDVDQLTTALIGYLTFLGRLASNVLAPIYIEKGTDLLIGITVHSGQFKPVATDWSLPTLLKKSAMAPAAKKYALEIEIFTSGKGYWTQTSHNCVLNRRVHRPLLWPFQKTAFFNRIGC